MEIAVKYLKRKLYCNTFFLYDPMPTPISLVLWNPAYSLPEHWTWNIKTTKWITHLSLHHTKQLCTATVLAIQKPSCDYILFWFENVISPFSVWNVCWTILLHFLWYLMLLHIFILLLISYLIIHPSITIFCATNCTYQWQLPITRLSLFVISIYPLPGPHLLFDLLYFISCFQLYIDMFA